MLETWQPLLLVLMMAALQDTNNMLKFNNNYKIVGNFLIPLLEITIDFNWKFSHSNNLIWEFFFKFHHFTPVINSQCDSYYFQPYM